jgi:hypothetical protein
MNLLAELRRRRLALAGAVMSGIVAASLSIGGAAMASGSTVHPVSSARTAAWVDGKTVTIQYPQNFFCDKSVSSGAGSGCEVGTAANRGPVPHADRQVLYVLVPLFKGDPSPAPMCATASCPNHPMDIDLSRIAPALGAAPQDVRDFPLPPHSHILDGPGGGWWKVDVVGVTSQAAWSKLAAGRSESRLLSLAGVSGSDVTGLIPTNLYLFFNVVGSR